MNEIVIAMAFRAKQVFKLALIKKRNVSIDSILPVRDFIIEFSMRFIGKNFLWQNLYSFSEKNFIDTFSLHSTWEPEMSDKTFKCDKFTVSQGFEFLFCFFNSGISEVVYPRFKMFQQVLLFLIVTAMAQPSLGVKRKINCLIDSANKVAFPRLNIKLPY